MPDNSHSVCYLRFLVLIPFLPLSINAFFLSPSLMIPFTLAEDLVVEIRVLLSSYVSPTGSSLCIQQI